MIAHSNQVFQIELQERSKKLTDGEKGSGVLDMKYAKHQRSINGFTLIELMIAVAIVAILVALAVPAYSDYMIRSKVAECINGAAVAKVQLSEYKQTLGTWPPTLGKAGLSNSGDSKFCNSIALDPTDPNSGTFIVDVDVDVVDSVLTKISPKLKPTVTSSNIINWACTPGDTHSSDVKFLPSNCRGS